jgi:hypothetical protein
MATLKKLKSAKGAPRDAEYRFKIDAFTPDTIPMARLAEYMAELAVLLGETASVHFRRVEEGSTILVQQIEREAVPKVQHRTTSVRRGDGPQDAMRAFKGLNKLLREDNAVGELTQQGQSTATILHFPGRLLIDEKFTSIQQHGSIDGIINRIGGKDETVHITLESEGKQHSGCYTSRAIAKELGHLLFEPVRLFGRGRWSRDEDGNWTLEHFKVESFEALSSAPLSTALAELRNVPLDWDENTYRELKLIRQGPGRKQNGGH